MGSSRAGLACLLTILFAAVVCAPPKVGSTEGEPASEPAANPGAQATDAPAATPTPVARVPSQYSASVPDPAATGRPRFFVASESSEQVWVLEGEPLAVVAKIPVGKLPHNISVSPDGRWVAVANRMGNTVSIIDPRVLKEVARVVVGKQPHDILWAPDARTIFVGSEREGFIHRIEAETWRPLPPLTVGVPQHTLAIWSSRPTELWFTVTNSDSVPHLLVYSLETNKIIPIQGAVGVHDVFFTPDGSEVWFSTSGFIDKPSDRLGIVDPVGKKLKEEIQFAGRYPFHSMKQNRDALFLVDQTDVIVLSDHLQQSLLFVDWKQRKIVGSVKLGPQPFHSAYTPGRYYTTTNVDNALRVIDVSSMRVIQRVEIPKPHGVVFALVS